jgi:hypothetical protein
MDKTSEITIYGLPLGNDLFVSDVEMFDIRFVPMLTSVSLQINVKYKRFVISFGSLPAELQQQLKQIAIERISNQLEKEKSKSSS